MNRFLRTIVLLTVASTTLSGCGLLPTDKPPTGGLYSVSYSPDPKQPAWERILFGTRWIGEGPPQ